MRDGITSLIFPYRHFEVGDRVRPIVGGDFDPETRPKNHVRLSPLERGRTYVVTDMRPPVAHDIPGLVQLSGVLQPVNEMELELVEPSRPTSELANQRTS